MIHTFSIVAHDPDEQAWGVATASKFLAVGGVVNWAQAGAGAVATQSYARVTFGPDGLAMMAQGKSAQETLDALLAGDPDREYRQVGLVDARGETAAFTGAECMAWAGHRAGPYFTCQGNILTGEETLDAMATTFTSTEGTLADRLVAALLAGDNAGGDSRGKQAAGLLVVKPNAGYGGDNDRYCDLRVDDDPNPVRKLRQLLTMHHVFFGPSTPSNLIAIDEEIAVELQEMMLDQGYLGGKVSGDWDEMSRQAFWALISNENLEERWSLDDQPDMIDRVVLEYLRGRFGS